MKLSPSARVGLVRIGVFVVAYVTFLKVEAA